MLPLLAVSLLFFWSVYQVRYRQKNFHQKRGMISLSPVFLGNITEKWEAGVWNQGIFGILFCVWSTSYVETIQEATIYRLFFTQLHCNYVHNQVVRVSMSCFVAKKLLTKCHFFHFVVRAGRNLERELNFERFGLSCAYTVHYIG